MSTVWKRLRDVSDTVTRIWNGSTFTIADGPGEGLRMDSSRSRVYQDGTAEMPVQRALMDVLRPGAVAYDIGANVGFFSLIAARAVGSSGRVYSFEPVPENARLIRRNASLNTFDHIQVVEGAVAEESGTITLTLAEHPGGATLAREELQPPPDAKGEITVRAVCLDEEVEAGRLPAPDVIKIDVEGAELVVLDSMSSILRTRRPILICEVDAAEEDTLRARQQAIQDRLVAAEYRVELLPQSYRNNAWCVEHLLAHPAGRS